MGVILCKDHNNIHYLQAWSALLEMTTFITLLSRATKQSDRLRYTGGVEKLFMSANHSIICAAAAVVWWHRHRPAVHSVLVNQLYLAIGSVGKHWVRTYRVILWLYYCTLARLPLLFMIIWSNYKIEKSLPLRLSYCVFSNRDFDLKTINRSALCLI